MNEIEAKNIKKSFGNLEVLFPERFLPKEYMKTIK